MIVLGSILAAMVLFVIFDMPWHRRHVKARRDAFRQVVLDANWPKIREIECDLFKEIQHHGYYPDACKPLDFPDGRQLYLGVGPATCECPACRPAPAPAPAENLIEYLNNAQIPAMMISDTLHYLPRNGIPVCGIQESCRVTSHLDHVQCINCLQVVKERRVTSRIIETNKRIANLEHAWPRGEV